MGQSSERYGVVMKQLMFLLLAMVFTPWVFAHDDCFLAQENGVMIQQEGECALRQAPCSTFKIAISLMGFNEGILTDTTHPQWPFKQGYSDFLAIWRQSHNPVLWMKNSCVWYSQVITQKLGMKRFKHYVHSFAYGNQDVSGDKGRDNGLTRAWLSSSLRISPQEQIDFLTRLKQHKLPVSAKAVHMTEQILFVEELPGAWKLFGKTGAGYFFNEDGAQQQNKQIGWFVGWVEKGARTIYFSQLVTEQDNKEFSTGKHAREMVKQKLLSLVAQD